MLLGPAHTSVAAAPPPMAASTPLPPPLDHLAVMRRWRDWRRGRGGQNVPSPSPSMSPSPSPFVPPAPAPLLLLAPMEGLADRPMRVALARLQRRAAARIIPGDPRTDPPAAVAAARAILDLRHDRSGGNGDDASSLSSSFASPGFDEACQEFIRVPGALSPGGRVSAVARGVCKSYRRDELGSTPLAAQLMGSDPELMAAAARTLVSSPSASPPFRRRGGLSDKNNNNGNGSKCAVWGGRAARHVSLNCGCPANTVTGHGAGSSLLRDPRALEVLVASMRGALT
jgi:hypothetical protein